jgi:hypothetical protein
MNGQDALDRTLTSWLSEGPNRMPDRLLEAIVQDVAQRPQRRNAWLPAGVTLNRFVLAASGAAAVLLLIVFGMGLLSNGQPFGPAASTAPSPSPEPPATPMAVPKPPGGPIAAGTYYMDVAGQRFTFTMFADGWQSLRREEGDGVSWETSASRDFLGWTVWEAPAGTGVYTDGCAWTMNFLTPPPGPSADDLAEAIAAQDSWQSTGPIPTSVDGHQATRLSVTIPADIDLTTCHGGLFQSWGGRYYQGAGQTDEMWILELDGRRLVMFATYLPGSPPDRRDQLQQLVESVEIDPVP